MINIIPWSSLHYGSSPNLTTQVQVDFLSPSLLLAAGTVSILTLNSIAHTLPHKKLWSGQCRQVAGKLPHEQEV